MAKEIYKKDLYEILGVPEDATDKQIVKGYRKRALKCHPDKNSDNPKATELFLELSKALEILTDIAARAAYDQSRKAKKAAAERNKVLDSKRKKFKDELEARERAAGEPNLKEKTEVAEKKLQAEIERLRKEGSRLLEQEQERLRQNLKKHQLDSEDDDDVPESEILRIKLKWKVQKSDPGNGGYDESLLKRILSCYGQIGVLILSSKRKGSAIVEFEKSGVSSDILEETGNKDNPFSIEWLSGKPVKREADGYSISGRDTTLNYFTNGGVSYRTPDLNSTGGVIFDNSKQCSNYSSETSFASDRDYESLVLMKMRQAEERKRLIEQMKKEDEEEG